MKNFKKIALGLLTGAMAIGFSAFTNHSDSSAHLNKAVKSGMITDDYLVQSLGAGQFAESTDFDASNCATSASLRCGYSVTSTGKSNIPDQSSYTASQISNYVSHGWLTPAPGSSNALYQ